jgi:hypothetical protein
MISEAVRNNRRTATATDDEVKEEVQLFLHGAADRCGGKVERMKRARQRKQESASSPDAQADDMEFSD